MQSQEERAIRRKEAQERKRAKQLKAWSEAGFVSLELGEANPPNETSLDEEYVSFVAGDVTRPYLNANHGIIVQ